MVNTNINAQAQRRTNALRRAVLRRVQIWVPDTRCPGFAEECRRQSGLAAQADRADEDLLRFMDESLAEFSGWNK